VKTARTLYEADRVELAVTTITLVPAACQQQACQFDALSGIEDRAIGPSMSGLAIASNVSSETVVVRISWSVGSRVAVVMLVLFMAAVLPAKAAY
jgi:hypothetical protein